MRAVYLDGCMRQGVLLSTHVQLFFMATTTRAIANTPKAIKAGIHIGANTHHQLILMVPTSFNTTSTAVRIENTGKLTVVVFVMVQVSLLFCCCDRAIPHAAYSCTWSALFYPEFPWRGGTSI